MSVQRDDILARLTSEHDVVDFLWRLGIEGRAKGREILCLCPFHNDHNPSCAFFNKGNGWAFNCPACGAGGDVIGFGARFAKIDADAPGGFPKLMEWFGGVLGVAGREGVGGGISAERMAEMAREREAKAAASRAIAQRRRAEQVGQALTLWNESQPCSVPPGSVMGGASMKARRYLETRGVDWRALDANPTASKWDKLWRWHPRPHRTYWEWKDGVAGGELIKREEKAPHGALVLGLVSHELKIVAVQRIYLGAAGGKIEYGLDSKGGGVLVKATLGSLCGDDRDGGSRGGVTCRLTGRVASGILCVCEGADATGPALLQGVMDGPDGGAAVWPCLSTEGLRAFRLSKHEAEWVRAVRICGDYDKSKAGQKAAAACGSNLMKQVQGEEWKSWAGGEVDVRICMPDARVSEELVNEMMEAA